MPLTQVTIEAFGNLLRLINSSGNVLAAWKTYFVTLVIAFVLDPSLRLFWFKGGSFNVTELPSSVVVSWSRDIELGGLLTGIKGDSERLACEWVERF
jgi:hypothetical protein